MRRFDYSFLDDGQLPARFVSYACDIYSLKSSSQLRKKQFETVFDKLQSIAKVQSIKSSNAIEGIVTSDKRIAEIVNGNSAPLNHDEAEISGYRDALNLVHENYQNIPFCVDTILSLHKTMLAPAGDELAGKYKETDNVIVEVDAKGNRMVRFRPLPASETAQAMQQLELAYTAAYCNSHINQLLLIPCVILDFLCIHPFRDGNGRISRLLSLLLLYRAGFDAGKYVSFEEQINKYKDLYYDALQRSSAGWETNQNDYFPFMENFLATLYMCYKEMDKHFVMVNGKKANKSMRIEAVFSNTLLPMSKADLCNLCPDISPSTIEAVLGKMVKEGKIRKIGNARATKYIKIFRG